MFALFLIYGIAQELRWFSYLSNTLPNCYKLLMHEINNKLTLTVTAGKGAYISIKLFHSFSYVLSIKGGCIRADWPESSEGHTEDAEQLQSLLHISLLAMTEVLVVFWTGPVEVILILEWTLLLSAPLSPQTCYYSFLFSYFRYF